MTNPGKKKLGIELSAVEIKVNRLTPNQKEI